MGILIFAIVVFLTIVTSSLIAVAFGFRLYHTWESGNSIEFRTRILPLIFEYMEDGSNYSRFKRLLKSKREIQYFAAILYEFIDELDGEERQRLQKLLRLPTLYEQKLRKLNSGNPNSQIQACFYFGRLIYLRESVTDRIEWLLDVENEHVSYAAASALMASDDPNVRGRALLKQCVKEQISRLSIIELLYQFNRPKLEQFEVEAELLREILSNDSITNVSRIVLIRGIADIGYYQLIDFLYEYLIDHYKSDKVGGLTIALLHALGKFEYKPVVDFILRRSSKSDLADVRQASIQVLVTLDTRKYVQHFVMMLDDKSSRVRIAAAYALAKCGSEGLQVLLSRPDSPQLSEKVFKRILTEATGGQYVG